jgi:ADP-heptose:LPS heptosyltransferase
MSRLHIVDRRERTLVSAADHVFAAAAAVTAPFRRRRCPDAPGRILLLRMERIGDLLMALPAIRDVRELAPGAEIDLVVGSWNLDLARAVDAVTRVQALDAAWLARDHQGLRLPSLLRAARRWRGARYDLAINFEPDVRSNMLLSASGAAWTVGYRSGGGGALLDRALDYDTRLHTTENARRLVAAVFGRTPPHDDRPGITVPAAARANAARRLGAVRGPLVGLHLNGGRPIKQWDQGRFADVARRLISSTGATIVFTGSGADRRLVEETVHALPPGCVIDTAGDNDLLTVAAILERLDLLITGDTGPMHLAAAVGTPIVAVFGPSDPRRYAPNGPHDRVVRVDLPCSPCNRIRLPPARCAGHTPDCLALVSADSVFTAATAVLATSRRRDDATTRSFTA